MTEAEAIRLKRLRYRAWHRGTKEMDLIFGTFADRELEGLNQVDLDAFETLLNAEDQEISDWLMGRSPVPDAFDTPVFRRVKTFEHVAISR